jgi:hypothetical protein
MTQQATHVTTCQAPAISGRPPERHASRNHNKRQSAVNANSGHRVPPRDRSSRLRVSQITPRSTGCVDLGQNATGIRCVPWRERCTLNGAAEAPSGWVTVLVAARAPRVVRRVNGARAGLLRRAATVHPTMTGVTEKVRQPHLRSMIPGPDTAVDATVGFRGRPIRPRAQRGLCESCPYAHVRLAACAVARSPGSARSASTSVPTSSQTAVRRFVRLPAQSLGPLPGRRVACRWAPALNPEGGAAHGSRLDRAAQLVGVYARVALCGVQVSVTATQTRRRVDARTVFIAARPHAA